MDRYTKVIICAALQEVLINNKIEYKKMDEMKRSEYYKCKDGEVNKDLMEFIEEQLKYWKKQILEIEQAIDAMYEIEV